MGDSTGLPRISQPTGTCSWPIAWTAGGIASRTDWIESGTVSSEGSIGTSIAIPIIGIIVATITTATIAPTPGMFRNAEQNRRRWWRGRS